MTLGNHGAFVSVWKTSLWNQEERTEIEVRAILGLVKFVRFKFCCLHVESIDVRLQISSC